MPTARFRVRVGADYACFSRPEFKVERVSYLMMTPSAARGVLEAIFWKPEFRWEIRSIWLLRPIRQTSLLRNEVESRQGGQPFFVEDRRQQRAGLLLKDVEYLIEADLVLQPYADSPIPKYADQFERRLRLGQFHHAPYLGTRECSAWFEPAVGDERPVPLDLDLGPMLFEIAFREDDSRIEMEFYRHGREGRRLVKGYAEALFFPASLRAGIMHIPPELYRQVYERVGADV